jgi:hypothetical protein
MAVVRPQREQAISDKGHEIGVSCEPFDFEGAGKAPEIMT